MRDRPDVRYAHNGDVAIAYQVFGEGSTNLLCVPGFISNLHWNWDVPEYNRMLTGLGSFARVAIMDRRGVGLSDRLSPKDLPPLEAWASALGATPGRSNSPVTTSAASRSTSAPGSAHSRPRGKFW